MIDEPTRRLDEGALRALVPRVLAGLVRRGEDFDAAEDALQEALLEALRVWPELPPRDPRAWLAMVAIRRLVDARRSEAARHRREEHMYAEPRAAATEEGDEVLAPPDQAREHPRDEGAQRALVQPSRRFVDHARSASEGAPDMTSRMSIHSYSGSPPGPGSEET